VSLELHILQFRKFRLLHAPSAPAVVSVQVMAPVAAGGVAVALAPALLDGRRVRPVLVMSKIVQIANQLSFASISPQTAAATSANPAREAGSAMEALMWCP